MLQLVLALVLAMLPPRSPGTVCNREHPPTAELLTTTARRLFPDVVATTDTSANNIIAIVFDQVCQVRYDTTVNYRGSFVVPFKMAELFPLVPRSFEVAGARMIKNTPRTWLILYGVLK